MCIRDRGTGGAATGLLALSGEVDLRQQGLALGVFGRALFDEIDQFLHGLDIALHQVDLS